jgi:hypothetical protein
MISFYEGLQMVQCDLCGHKLHWPHLKEPPGWEYIAFALDACPECVARVKCVEDLKWKQNHAILGA